MFKYQKKEIELFGYGYFLTEYYFGYYRECMVAGSSYESVAPDPCIEGAQP